MVWRCGDSTVRRSFLILCLMGLCVLLRLFFCSSIFKIGYCFWIIYLFPNKFTFPFLRTQEYATDGHLLSYPHTHTRLLHSIWSTVLGCCGPLCLQRIPFGSIQMHRTAIRLSPFNRFVCSCCRVDWNWAVWLPLLAPEDLQKCKRPCINMYSQMEMSFFCGIFHSTPLN